MQNEQLNTVKTDNGGKKRRKVVAYVAGAGHEAELQAYAEANGLHIQYTFGGGREEPVVTAGMLRKGFKALGNVLRGKGSARRLLGKVRTRTSLAVGPFSRSFLTMLNYVTSYPQCEGLLVYDIGDIYPKDLSVVRWVIERVRAAGKMVAAVQPFDETVLPVAGEDTGKKYENHWHDLVLGNDFQPKSFPSVISLTVFENLCFCKCRFCYQVKHPESVIEEYMDDDIFQKIISYIPPQMPIKVVLGAGGEPFTYPKIHEMVRYVTEKLPLATTEYSTNGVIMGEENARRVIESGLKRLEVSLNVPTREDYEWFTGLDAYDRVVENMLNLIKMRDEMGSPTPYVVTKVMGLKRWADKINGFLKFWNDAIDEARVSPVSYYQDEELENIESLKLKPNPLVPTCFYLTDNIIIMPNGRYQLCCAPDFGGEKYGLVDLGNARDISIGDIWNSEKYRDLRRRNARGLPVDPNCMNCNVNHADFEADLIIKAKQQLLQQENERERR